MHKENDAPVSAYAEGDSGIVLATQGTEPFCNILQVTINNNDRIHVLCL